MTDTREKPAPYDQAIADELREVAASIGGSDSTSGLMILGLVYEYEMAPGGPRAHLRSHPLPSVCGGEVWRPIESAPKDGTIIVIGRYMVPWGFVRAFGYWVDERGISGWVATGAASEPPGVLGLAAPTHWIALPATPSQYTSSPPVSTREEVHGIDLDDLEAFIGKRPIDEFNPRIPRPWVEAMIVEIRKAWQRVPSESIRNAIAAMEPFADDGIGTRQHIANLRTALAALKREVG